MASSYIEGKKIFKKGLNGNAELACKHCHKGTLKLKRSQLKKMGNNLAKNLRQAGGHDVFKGKVSEQQFNSIVSYMKKRYRIK